MPKSKPPQAEETAGNYQVKTLLYDIENAPLLGYTWGTYQQNVLKVVRHSYMLSFAYRWLHEDETHVVSLRDFDLYDEDPEDDYGLCQELHTLLDEADIVVGHNNVGFDDKVVKGRLLQQGFTPPSPFRTADTLKIARKNFKLTNNKLDTIGELLQVGRKTPHSGFSLWVGCMNGCPDSWDKMEEYNKQDVDLLYDVYMKLRPWAFGHPDTRSNMAATACLKCGCTDLMKRGFARTTRTVRQRYQCKGCGAWLQDRLNAKIARPSIVGGT